MTSYKEKEDVIFKRSTLVVEKCASQACISSEVYKVEAYIDLQTEDLFLRLNRFIATETKEGYSIRWPKNSWEFFKLEYMPKWFVKKYPVKYTVHSVDFKIKYPEFQLTREMLGKGYIEIMETVLA